SVARDLKELARLNWDFHSMINELAHSRKLIAMFRILNRHVARTYIVEFPTRIERSNEEHSLLLNALRNKDALEAGTIMEQHVVSAGADLIEYLRERGNLL